MLATKNMNINEQAIFWGKVDLKKAYPLKHKHLIYLQRYVHTICWCKPHNIWAKTRNHENDATFVNSA